MADCDEHAMLSSHTYVSFVASEDLAAQAPASNWTYCAQPGRAYVACSTSCPSF
jgi:hypothetical protein